MISSSSHNTTLSLINNYFFTIFIKKINYFLIPLFSVMVAHLVGNVYDECKNHVSNDVNHLALSIQKVFQCTVKFTAIPAKTAKFLKLNIWKDFVLAVENSIKSGKIMYSSLNTHG